MTQVRARKATNRARPVRAKNSGRMPAEFDSANVAPAPLEDDERIRRQRRFWFAALISLTWAYVVVPRTLQSQLADKSKQYVGQDSTPYNGLAKQALTDLTYLLILCCVAILVIWAKQARLRHGTGLVIVLLPWVYLMARDQYAAVSLHKAMVLYPLITVAIFVLRPDIRGLKVLGYLIGVTAIISLAMGALEPAKGILSHADGTVIMADKQIVPGGTLIGMFTDGNNLGQFLIMGFAAIGFIESRSWRWTMWSTTTFALVWSASRSSLLALVAMIVVALILQSITRPNRGVVGAIAVTVQLTVVISLPLVTTVPGAYSNRGYIWHQSLMAWAQNPTFGLGANFYAKIGASSSALGGTVFHGHNEFVHALVTGGMVLAVLMGVVIVAGVAASARLTAQGSNFGFLYLVTFLGACLFEVSFAIVDREFLFPVLVVPLTAIMFGTFAEASDPAAVEAAAVEPARAATPRTATARRRAVRSRRTPVHGTISARSV